RLALARQSLGISRERILAGGLLERLSIANFTPHPERLIIELGLDVDAADIFEVRGRPRPSRGRRLPIAVRTDGRVTFGYEGLDGRIRWVYVEPSGAGEIAPVDPGSEGSVVVRWTREVPAGGRFELEWRVWSDLSGPPEGQRVGSGAGAPEAGIGTRDRGAPAEAPGSAADAPTGAAAGAGPTVDPA